MFVRLAVVFLLIFTSAHSADIDPDSLFIEAGQQLQRGDYALARDNYGSIWRQWAKTRGETDPLTLDARIFFGQMLTMTGNPGEALDVLGPISSGSTRQALIARGSFALALRQSGNVARAATMLAALIEEFPRTPAENDVHRGRLHAEYAACLAHLGKTREAEQSARESVRLVERAGLLGAEHLPAVRIILGQVHLLAGRDEEAARTLREAVANADPAWRASHPEAGIVDGALGILALRRGRYAEAETFLRHALAAFERMLGLDHAEVGMIASQLAEAVKKQKRKEESRAWEARARRIVESQRAIAKVSAWSWRKVE